MKRTIAVLPLALGMALGFISHASAQQSTVTVAVPFDFSVGGRVLPQGTYRIGADKDFVSFKDSEQKPHLFLRGSPGNASKNGQSALVFDNVGGKYFLTKIVTSSGSMNMEFPQSDLEKKAKNRMTAELAMK